MHYINTNGMIYRGDRQSEDREATPEEIAIAKSPLRQFYKWNGDTWMVDTAKKQDVITSAKDKIDAETDAAILSGFEYQGMAFKLSLENQMNYKAEYDIRDQLTYPHTIKHNSGYMTLNSAAEYEAFYLAGMQYIRQTIVAGWTRKDALPNKTTTELIEILNGGQA